MSTTVAARSRPKRRVKKANWWSYSRFVTTVAFFLLIAGNIWTGTICYVDVGAVGIACPLGVAQVMAASRTFIPTLALAALMGVLLVVIFGRAFCGWLCPGRWIFNRGPVSRTMPSQVRAWAQRAILGGVVGAAWVCHTPVFCTICPAGVVCRGAIAAGTGGNILPMLGWLGALVGAEWASGYSWCRDLCPLGIAISKVSRFNPFLKVKSNPERCLPCTVCQKVCPEGLNLGRDEDIASCTKCFACQNACPRGAVEIKLFQ